MKVTKNPIKLYASAKAVITRFLYLPGRDRVKNIIERVDKLDEKEVNDALDKVKTDFAHRHRDLEKILLDHFTRVCDQLDADISHFSIPRRLLLGAFFTKEYSIQAAALFNPSIVAHPDQKGVEEGKIRFVMSLRATGEGHISSIVFQTGIADSHGNISLDPPTGYFTALKKNEEALYTKSMIEKGNSALPGFAVDIGNLLPDTFTASAAAGILKRRILEGEVAEAEAISRLKEFFDANYELEDSSHIPVNEKVIFPNANAESMGMEDVRLVQFKDGENECYYGTYTAYNGKEIRTHILETTDFSIFKVRTLSGRAVSDKGMALFPEKVNGRYVMISRQGGEKMSIMFSDDLYTWNDHQVLMEPEHIWEMVQLGNCGSPVKTDEGWLLLTHGVGAMRTYVMSAILLDLEDPSRITGRLTKPLVAADESEREGYVPNVVYTCGWLRHGDVLVIPYAVSDSATGFITIALNELLKEIKTGNAL